jgi:hypothetical protein
MPIITFVDTKPTVDAIRHAIGRDIEIVTLLATGCSICSLDPVHNSSIDSYCSGCGGYYWITTPSGVTVSGHVRWAPFDDVTPQTGGIVYLGDCVVTIEFTPANLSLISSADYVVVDNKKMVLDKYVLRGHKAINRIRLMLKEMEK